MAGNTIDHDALRFCRLHDPHRRERYGRKTGVKAFAVHQ